MKLSFLCIAAKFQRGIELSRIRDLSAFDVLFVEFSLKNTVRKFHKGRIQTVFLCWTSITGHSYHYLIEYGDTYSLRLHRRAESIEFTKKNSIGVTVLWKRNDPQMNEESRRKLVGSSYVMHNLTQDDSGIYIVSDKNRISLATTAIEVKGDFFMSNFCLSKCFLFHRAQREDSVSTFGLNSF